MPCLDHYRNDIIKRYLMHSIPHQGICSMIYCPHCGKSIPFDTRNLYKPHERITCKSKVMLKPHLRGIFNLSYSSSHNLSSGSACHGTGNSDLSLASGFRS